MSLDPNIRLQENRANKKLRGHQITKLDLFVEFKWSTILLFFICSGNGNTVQYLFTVSYSYFFMVH